MIKQIVALVLAVLALAGNAVSADLDLTSCGTVVPAMANARLPADLDCSTAAGPGVVLEMGAALDLNGFTLVGNPSAFGADGVSCADGCRVDGPGTVRSFGQDGISAQGVLTVHNAVVSDNGRYGIVARTVTVADSSISSNVEYGVFGHNVANVSRCSISGNGGGVIADNRPTVLTLKGNATVQDSTLSGNGFGVFAVIHATIVGSVIQDNSSDGVDGHAIFVDSSTIQRNFDGLYASGFYENPSIVVTNSTVADNLHLGIDCYWTDFVYRRTGTVRISDTHVNNNGYGGIATFAASVLRSELVGNSENGIFAIHASLKGSNVSGSGLDGVHLFSTYSDVGNNYVAKAALKDSSVTSNGGAGVLSQGRVTAVGSTVTGNTVDIESQNQPRLASTTCNTSEVYGQSTSWGVCSLDP